MRQLIAFDFALRIGVVLLAAGCRAKETVAARRLALGLFAVAFGSELASLLDYFVLGEIYDPTHYKLFLRSGMIPP